MARTPQEIFEHHGGALVAGDLDEIRQAYVEFLAELPDATLDVPRLVFEGDVLYLEWTAEAPTVRVTDGTDTFVFSDDGIRVHTLHYTTEKVS